MDGLIKHNGPVLNLKNFNKILGKEIFKNKIIFKTFPSLESQVSAISDDIAYNNHDLEDGLRAGLFSVDQIKSLPVVGNIIKKHIKKQKKYRKEIIINQITRELINFMVIDVIKNTKKNIKLYKIKKLRDVLNHNSKIVDFSDKVKKVDLQIKHFLKINMYNNKKVVVNTNIGKIIIEDLFKYLIKKPKKFINKNLLKRNDVERVVADFIAGMTDRFAINLHKQIK